MEDIKMSDLSDKISSLEKASEHAKEKMRINRLFKDTLDGKFGDGEERKKALGDDYEVIQNRINDYYAKKAQSELNIDDITTPTCESATEYNR